MPSIRLMFGHHHAILGFCDCKNSNYKVNMQVLTFFFSCQCLYLRRRKSARENAVCNLLVSNKIQVG